jgi:hypothetical protein
LKFKSPFKSNSIEDNALLYNHFLAMYLSSNIEHFTHIENSRQHAKNVIVAVDSRFNIATFYATLISYYNLLSYVGTQSWDIFIFTREENIAKYHEYNRHYNVKINVVSHQALNNTSKFSIETYNSVLKDASFWKCLIDHGYNKCLVVQDDGFLVNSSNMDNYMRFDYVGAPWADGLANHYIKNNINKELVGNGGFSLRDINMMFVICNKYQQEKTILFYNNFNEIPEDVYFVKCLVCENAMLPTANEATCFSIEQVIPTMNLDKVIGFHKFWMYHPPSTVWKVFKSFLA